jgi:hypothetical protein
MTNHPHSVPSGHLSPCPGERNPGWMSAGIAAALFLSPGQGERWPEGTEWGWFDNTCAGTLA